MANTTSTSASPTTDSALAYVEQPRQAFLEGLKDLLRIPSISTLPRHKKDMRRAAKLVAAELARIGLKQARVIKTAGQPLVYAEWLEAPDKPTVLLYGHYDVQPVDPIELWTTAPFHPEIPDHNLHAPAPAAA